MLSIASQDLAATPSNNDVATQTENPNVRVCPVLTGCNGETAQNATNPDPASACAIPPSGPTRTSPSDDRDPAPDDAFLRGQQDRQHEQQEFDVYRLTAIQNRAIDLLVAGFPAVQVAETLHISDRTIRRWKNAQPEFIAEYNRRVAEHSTVTAGRLRQLADTAVTHVESIFLGKDDRLKHMASLRILSSLISRNLAHRHGPTTAPEILAEFIKQRMRAYNEDDKAPIHPGRAEDYLTELSIFLEEEQLKDQEEHQGQAGCPKTQVT